MSGDATLAQTAIDEAITLHGNPKGIATAKTEFVLGNRAVDANDDEEAIERWKGARYEAQRAVKKIPSP